MKEVFGDSAEIAGQLRRIGDASDPSDSYWLSEAAVHIEGLYRNACDSDRKLNRMRQAFHVNMLRAHPDKSHADISAEIDKACG